MKKLIVFTDLDGTLLNHDTYDWQPALPAINRLREMGFPLILNSSKTSSEINQIRQVLDNHDPYICENGAVVHMGDHLKLIEGHQEVLHFARPYQYIKQVLGEIREKYYFDMFGFDDIDIQTLMDLTELDQKSATAAKQREASEPLVWNDNEESLENFKKLLEKSGLTLTKGGRFYHVISPISKGDSVSWLINQYQRLEPETEWFSVGLGDSVNDIPMLEQVNYPVLIINPHGKKPDVGHIPDLIVSRMPGPAGWNAEVLTLIDQIEDMKNG